MVRKIKVEEIDGKACLLLDGDIIAKTRLCPGDVVRVIIDKEMILIVSEDLAAE